MRQTTIGTLVCLALIASGCRTPDGNSVAATSEVQTQADRQAILQLLRDLEQAELAGDADALADLFMGDMVLARSSLPDIMGRQAWKSVMEEVYAQETMTAASIRVDGLVVLDDWAVSWGQDSVSVEPKNGEPFDVTDRHVVIYRRQGDSWEIASLINDDAVVPVGLLKELESLAARDP